MKFPRPIQSWLAAGLAVGSFVILPLAAQTMSNTAVPAALLPDSQPSPPPVARPVKAPVQIFRELLTMAPAQRENYYYLTNRPPATRDRILAKVREYEALPPGERELRLQATELRWYLLPLLQTAPADRGMRLAMVPQYLRPVIDARLSEWDVLPPPMQQEFLDNERALSYFTAPLPGETSEGLPEADAQRWKALSEEQRQQMANQFNDYFNLPSQARQKTLGVLSDAERQEMEKTLQTFAQLPPAQRRDCVNAFVKFASMSASARQEFLKNAQRWQQMSAQDRQAWRDLVAHVPPLPPEPAVPPELMPQAAPSTATPPVVRPTVATNHN
ncbi:MAG: DUF3106 domain-containing protein [Verrucomicrobiota bacterium]|jgi:hypothetical protein